MAVSDAAIVVLGMHRSGTSCLAGMLAAAGLASAGEAVRNWDNARGHHEMLDVVRLDEAVLAHSGGHWLAPPAEVRWTEAHARERDRLLRARLGGRPALLKDPRMLLALPFWRASAVPLHVVGIVRHPLAVARSLESWRGLPLAEGLALWCAHNRALTDDRARHGYAVIDFDAPGPDVIAAVAAAGAGLTGSIDAAALASAYDARLVHHDDGDAPDARAVPGLDAALALHAQLAGGRASAAMQAPLAGGRASAVAHAPPTGGRPRAARRAFPRAELAAFARLVDEGDFAEALVPARAALAQIEDAAAVIVPAVTALVRRRALGEARQLIAEHAARLDAGLAALLLGKVALAAGEAAEAVRRLEAACAAPEPLYQARRLLPDALRAAGRTAEARARLHAVAREALYPHAPLATLAEWSWLDGDRGAALAEMAQAIAAAPPHRHGRLRTRRAEWLLAAGDAAAARDELERAIAGDPGYGRSRDLLAQLPRAGAPTRGGSRRGEYRRRMALVLTVAPHPLLEVGAFVVHLGEPLGERATPPAIAALLEPGAAAPLTTDDAVRAAVRDLLRAGGFKPSGRSKPASEYLHAAVADGRAPHINALVDACNAASLHAGLPISLVDLAHVIGELRITVAPPATSYVFNPSGQVIDASGLVCLYDREGPTGTPVKDAQRTKTSPATRDALAVVWGTSALPGRTAAATAWYRALSAQIPGATLEDVELRTAVPVEAP